MPIDQAEPWPEATYNGFAGPAQPPPRPERRWGRIALIGAGGAVAAGLVFGFLIRPNLSARDPDAAREHSGPAVPIELNEPPVQTPKSAGKLDVLPPGQLAASGPPPQRVTELAPQDAPAAVEPPPAASPAPPRYPSLGAQPTPIVPPPAMRPAPPIAVQPPQAYAARGPCAGAGSLAEQMVCQDPGLSAADRDLNRAYRRAMASGAMPPGALRAEQRDWLAIREDAARRSPRALASVYAQRIDELNAMAQDGRRRGYDDEDDGPG